MVRIWKDPTKKEMCGYGLLKRLVGVSAAAEEVLDVAPYRDLVGVWRPYRVDRRVCDRALYLHAVLIAEELEQSLQP